MTTLYDPPEIPDFVPLTYTQDKVLGQDQYIDSLELSEVVTETELEKAIVLFLEQEEL